MGESFTVPLLYALISHIVIIATGHFFLTSTCVIDTRDHASLTPVIPNNQHCAYYIKAHSRWSVFTCYLMQTMDSSTGPFYLDQRAYEALDPMTLPSFLAFIHCCPHPP